MIPSIDDLARLAKDVLARVPHDVLTGEAPASLYGVGFLGRWALGDFAARGIVISSLFDGNPEMESKVVSHIRVHLPTRLAAIRPDFVFIAARHAVLAVSERLADLGIPHVSCDAFHAARDFAAFAAIHNDYLDDERSRLVLRAVLATMLSGDRAYLLPVFEKDQYFCLPQFSGIDKETYVDAGAYVGDSLERFVWTSNGIFNRAICFEPGPRQFAALGRRIERLAGEWALADGQIVAVPAALGEASAETVAESVNGQMTNLALGSGDARMQVESLDSYLGGEAITFLKADVEGMEMALLEGAAATIRAFRPKLAICVYHYPTDIPAIANHLAALVPDYRFALRHHSPQFMETVLYAWVD